MKYINLEYHPSDSRIRIVDCDVSQTLNTRMGTGGGNVPLVLMIVSEDRSGVVRSSNETETFPAIRTQMKHREPMVVLTNDSIRNSRSRWTEGDDAT